MAPLQKADLSDRDAWGALAPDKERNERETSVMEPESGIQRELPIPDVDITLLMVELKYDDQQGIKICEIQPVCFSSFLGCDYVYKRNGVIGRSITQYLSQFGHSFWFMNPDVSHIKVRKQFFKQGWKPFSTLEVLSSIKEIQKNGSKTIQDRSNLLDYHAIIYPKYRKRSNFKNVESKFSALVFIDKAFIPYLYDKYSQSLLFKGNPILEQAKPKWILCSKKSSHELFDEITTSIESDLFVIKPKESNQGKGVIIVSKNDLEKTLKIIVDQDKNLKNNHDRGFNYWATDSSQTFLVEQFIETSPLIIEEMENRPFDVTFRLAVAFVYHKNALHLHFLGHYCDLPDIPLDSAGSLNDKHRTSLSISKTIKTPAAIKDKIYAQLKVPLLLMYKRVLGFALSNLEEGIEEAIVTECDLEELILSMPQT